MMDIWSWICELPNSDEWTKSDSPYHLDLYSSRQSDHDKTTRTFQLRAERFSGSNSEALTFTVCLGGFHSLKDQKVLWTSDTCHLSSEKPFLPLVLQLLREIITRSPTAHNSTCPRSKLQELKPEPVSWIMETHSPESFSSFFNLLFLTRLFWLCVCDAPSEVGSMYFESLLGPNLEALSCIHAQVLRTFLVTVGVDAEVCFMRTVGYILAKWLILRQVGVGLQTLTPLPGPLGFSYAMESHGLWVLKGFSPVLAMKPVNSSPSSKFPIVQANESVLKYALAHQQLEAVIQLEYSVMFHDGYIQVNARVDNLRFHVAKLGFRQNDDVEYGEERHFPSRVRVWVGPEVGATYVGGLSLGRSTGNAEKEVEMHRIVKSSSGNSKVPRVKAGARMTTRTKRKNWRWDQDAEGNAAIFDAVLCDNVTGQEILSGGGGCGELRNRYGGENRAFTKTGGLVLCGDECGGRVGWRLSKEMEGSVLKWRIGGQVWLSYCPNHVRSSYYETRCVEWCDEVDLPLIP
ncbi:hypothetical protein HS088_TW02G00178 [Tripterygium wilfordii]|uniref:Uncharacterized protein n=1 Tax=Tripterygium wilfordii TaxID=458696 RepID=A0A7J7DXQ8_TRIWF|nr:uncharacterized protein LOC120012256 [Tripterygium wilfordii]KAF5751168.1 hypothetical protein HS088_TW02G00178 [Tripterygium wilfordii]